MTYEEAVEKLEKWNVKFWADDKTKKIRRVELALRPIDWCGLCMNEGDYYSGGCCGQMSAFQDFLNGIFKGSGIVDCHTFRALIEMSEGHEGFSCYEDEKLLEIESLSELDDKDPIEKIAAIWQVVKDHLSVTNYLEKPSVPHDSLRQDAMLLVRSAHSIAFSEMFTDAMEDDKQCGQRAAAKVLYRAKLATAMKRIVDRLPGEFPGPFEGYGLRKKDNKELISNGFGPCLYEEERGAQAVIDLWKEQKDDEYKQWEIVPCKVTLEAGLVWQDAEGEEA